MMTSGYRCDCCGACCHSTLLVEAYELDAFREPALLDADIGGWRPTMEDLSDETRCILLAGGKPCRFLGDGNRCSIYPTRPNVCVGMQAGDEQCQQARSKMGLPAIEPLQLQDMTGIESPDTHARSCEHREMSIQS